jgi:hypothetical protein
MGWSIEVEFQESCSCAALCPCTLGPAKPDQEWCSGVFGMHVVSGDSDGVDLSGADVVLHFELPGDFLGGIDQARLYVDESLSAEQQREIDAIFHGEKGGVWGGMKEAIAKWLPTKVTKVEIDNGENPTTKVDGIGQVTLQRIKLEDGKAARLVDAPILAAFSIGEEELAYAQGTKFSDPDMRAWESYGHGGVAKTTWSG